MEASPPPPATPPGISANYAPLHLGRSFICYRDVNKALERHRELYGLRLVLKKATKLENYCLTLEQMRDLNFRLKYGELDYQCSLHNGRPGRPGNDERCPRLVRLRLSPDARTLVVYDTHVHDSHLKAGQAQPLSPPCPIPEPVGIVPTEGMMIPTTQAPKTPSPSTTRLPLPGHPSGTTMAPEDASTPYEKITVKIKKSHFSPNEMVVVGSARDAQEQYELRNSPEKAPSKTSGPSPRTIERDAPKTVMRQPDLSSSQSLSTSKAMNKSAPKPKEKTNNAKLIENKARDKVTTVNPVPKIIVKPPDKVVIKSTEKVAAEKGAIKSTEKVTIKPAGKVTVKPLEQIGAKAVEKVHVKPTDKAPPPPKSVDKTISKPAEKLIQNPQLKIGDRGVIKQAAESTIMKPIAQAVTKQSENIVKSVEKVSTKPVVIKPSEKAATKPSERSITKPPERFTSKPPDRQVTKPSEKVAVKPVERTAGRQSPRLPVRSSERMTQKTLATVSSTSGNGGNGVGSTVRTGVGGSSNNNNSSHNKRTQKKKKARQPEPIQDFSTLPPLDTELGFNEKQQLAHSVLLRLLRVTSQLPMVEFSHALDTLETLADAFKLEHRVSLSISRNEEEEHGSHYDENGYEVVDLEDDDIGEEYPDFENDVSSTTSDTRLAITQVDGQGDSEEEYTVQHEETAREKYVLKRPFDCQNEVPSWLLQSTHRTHTHKRPKILV